MDITLALKRAVERYPNGSTVLAAAMDMSPTTLRHKVSPTYDTQFCSPEEMLRLMEVTDDDGPGGRAISTNELRQIEAEGAQAIEAIQRLLAWASRSHEEGKPAHLRAVAGG